MAVYRPSRCGRATEPTGQPQTFLILIRGDVTKHELEQLPFGGLITVEWQSNLRHALPGEQIPDLKRIHTATGSSELIERNGLADGGLHLLTIGNAGDLPNDLSPHTNARIPHDRHRRTDQVPKAHHPRKQAPTTPLCYYNCKRFTHAKAGVSRLCERA